MPEYDRQGYLKGSGFKRGNKIIFSKMPKRDKTYDEEREKTVEALKEDNRFVSFNPSAEDWERFICKWVREAVGGLSAVDMTLKPSKLIPYPPIGEWLTEFDERTIMLEHNCTKFGMPFAECLPEGKDYDLHRWNAIELAKDNAEYVKEHGLDEFIIRYGDKNNLPEE